MISSYRDGRWTEPEPAPFSGLGEGDPAMAPDGSRLVFWSWRPAPDKPKEGGPRPDLWYVDIADGRYGEAKRIPGTLRHGGPSLAADGTLYCFRVGDDNKPRIVRARKLDAGYGPFEDASASLNGAEGGHDPYIAPDQSFIVFSSKRADSIGGDDLYLSFQKEGGWTAPRNLGPAVNSHEDEYCPCVSPDRTRLYFTRGRQGVLTVELQNMMLRPDARQGAAGRLQSAAASEAASGRADPPCVADQGVSGGLGGHDRPK